MARVISASDLVNITLEDEDIQAGIKYGIISRAWTYDRMGAQARGDFGKAIFRIAIGKAVQSAFERYLTSQGVAFERDSTDFKTEDYWDIRTLGGTSLDIKAFHYFSDFPVPGRAAPDPQRIVTSDLGESWSSFYPMLVPQDQFDRARKDIYVFALLAAPSSKRCPRTHRKPRALIALPFSQNPDLNQNFRLVHRREYADQRVKNGQSFEITIVRPSTHSAKPFRVTIGYGDIDGSEQRVSLMLNNSESYTITQATSLHYLRWHGDCPNLAGTDARSPLLQVLFRNVDRQPDLRWEVFGTSFEDVWIYPDALWLLGWITGADFNQVSQGHPSYRPSKNQNKNERDPQARTGGRVAEGTFCYCYPPPAPSGGTKNPNYYVLPQDLNPISTLSGYLTQQ